MAQTGTQTHVEKQNTLKAAPTSIAEVAPTSPSQPPSGPGMSSEEASQLRLEQLDERYANEREIRIRPNGKAQYTDAASSEQFKHFVEDCWVRSDPPRPSLKLGDDDHHKIVIIGAGFGGLLHAVRLLQAGFRVDDLAIIDAAGGFGGTWYWNRYPGLMCDTEAYIYMPLLEETGYMPKTKYAYGIEIREHADRIAKQWRLDDRALFSMNVQKLTWIRERNMWAVDMTSTDKAGLSCPHRMTADFVIIAPGILHKVKVSDHGTGNFEGPTFHTARWDYSITGGSPDKPTLSNLKDKKVGIIGTGATAVQAIPHLAKWSKELYVFQRTAAAVDVRGQCATDEKWWASEFHGKKGWQRERSRNFVAFTINANPAPEVNMIQDGWTQFPSLAALIGADRAIAPSDALAYVKTMRTLDLARSERLRARTDEIVTNKETADGLKAWYYGWCKRPTFHDDYLETFNLPHVTLVDTKGKGIEGIDKKGVVANGHQYGLDLLVYSTGFDLEVASSPASRANIVAIGRNGQKLEDKWTQGIKTLHGIITRDFPNLFFSSLSQGASSVNLTSALDVMAQHVAFIISAATKKGGESGRVIIEPTAIAEEAWADRIVVGAPARAPAMGCTPSTYNGEGIRFDLMPPEVRARAARAAPWPFGLNKFQDFLDEWHKNGDLSELEIQVV